MKAWFLMVRNAINYSAKIYNLEKITNLSDGRYFISSYFFFFEWVFVFFGFNVNWKFELPYSYKLEVTK